MLQSYLFSETSPSAAGTVASSQAVTGGKGPGVSGPIDDSDALDIAADLVGATGGTLDIYVQYSPNQGINWYDVVHFQQLASGAPAVRYRAPVSLYTNIAQPVVVGKDLTPALAANAMVNGAYGDRVRLVMVAGSGTTAGAPVVVRVTAQRTDPRNAS